ncbi:hypothetical protein ABZS71_06545 [Streptomyces sp. NPDC005393]|uniref:hypothetical protein n=1 Tax=Streptomyces sp. NPDC005393 TaxID=3157041 RepID=UPI0033BEA628
MDDSLSFESFYEGAKKAAHRAMGDHGRGEYDEFALHGGLAVEKLAKAVLVSKNPVYIAEPRNEDMLMYLGGHFQVAEDKVRTVGAKEAIARLRKIGVLQADPQLDLLILMRNGAAHASPDSAEAKGMISPLTQTIETLLHHLGKPLGTFWDRWTQAVKAAVNEQEDQVFRDVQLRIAQALGQGGPGHRQAHRRQRQPGPERCALRHRGPGGQRGPDRTHRRDTLRDTRRHRAAPPARSRGRDPRPP